MEKAKPLRPNKQECRLENWRVAELSTGTVLLGEVYGHSVIKDGTRVTTGAVDDRALNSPKPWAETQNTVYQLGRRA